MRRTFPIFGLFAPAILVVNLWPGEAAAGPVHAPPFPSGVSKDVRSQFHPSATPDIAGPGKISTAGNLWLKTTNIGVMGNPFTALSSDPSAQWPGPSGVEYLFFVGLWIGAKDPGAVGGASLRRVSANTEWRPKSQAPEDRIYESRPGVFGSGRLQDDDDDGRMDEEWLNGRDDDGDGRVDEDYAGVSDQMFSCVIRDDTPAAIGMAKEDPHVPLGLEVNQRTYSFALEGENDYVCVEYAITNVSGRLLDSVYVAFQVDQDVGHLSEGLHFADDLPEPRVPQGPDPSIPLPDTLSADPENPNFPYVEFVDRADVRYQPDSRIGGNAAPCWRAVTRVHGFTMTDDDGDGGLTPGASAFLLLHHTTDGRGLVAPERVGFRMYDYFKPGEPFSRGGPPANDAERYELISSRRNVDPFTGMITASRPTQPGDYFSVCSVGPYLDFAPGDTITVVWALAVQPIDYGASADDLPNRYGALIRTAVAAQRNFDGVHVRRDDLPTPPIQAINPNHGRETALIAPVGSFFLERDCRDDPLGPGRTVTSVEYEWFDFDCDTCTGVPGFYLMPWAVNSSPPPSPRLELIPGDRSVTLRWDNESEWSPDPQTRVFDMKGYAVWRARNWTRPVGSTGPGDPLWERLGTYFLYDDLNPLVERVADPSSPGETIEIRTSNVLVNRTWRPGNPMPPRIYASSVPCVPLSPGVCDTVQGIRHGRTADGRDTVAIDHAMTKFPVGRYEFTDDGLLNGVLYFYDVTAFDSTGAGGLRRQASSRRVAREADAVIPQASPGGPGGEDVFVVPNPYRARAAWDLRPNAADPTGTHVDFFRLPRGWTRIKIYTLAGDLVQEIRPDDVQVNGKLQRETPEDGQASWNLVSRNGQEVASGIYLFSVRGPAGTKQGKFVIVR